MRGKHANSAANRRDRTELEQRAVTAEHRAERLEKELAELRETSQRKISGLRAELTRAIKERDAVASPVIAQAEAKIRALMTERDEAGRERDSLHEKWDAFIRNVKDVLFGMGLTNVEAMEVVMASITPDGVVRTVYDGPRKGKTPQQIVAVERAQGKRGTVDLLHGR